MKVSILARPDHSLFLYKGIKDEIDVEMINFNVFHEKSMLSNFFSGKKQVSKEVKILHGLTISRQLLNFTSKHTGLDKFKWESKVSELFYKRALQKTDLDIIHYWPIYCHKNVNKLRSKFGMSTLGEVYMAHPYEAVKEIEDAYDYYKLDINKSYFTIDAERNLEFLQHEKNILVPSKYVAESYLKHFPNLNIHVSGFGFLGETPSIETQTYKTSKNLSLVFVGSVSVEKGVDLLIKAAIKSNSKLTLYGPVKQNQEHIFERYAMEKNIFFMGKISNSRVKRELVKHDVFVLPSLTDAYSLAVVEAVSCGLPVIVTNKTGNAMDVEKFGFGEVVKSKSVDDLLRAVEFLRVPENMERARYGITKFIQEEKEMGYPKRVLEIYKEIINKNATK